MNGKNLAMGNAEQRHFAVLLYVNLVHARPQLWLQETSMGRVILSDDLTPQRLSFVHLKVCGPYADD